MKNGKRCLVCDKELSGTRKISCSAKCSYYYNYYIINGKEKKKSVYQTHPELMKEWNYDKNNKLKLYPKKLFPGSHRKVFWECSKGHEWMASVNSRTNISTGGTNCPYCSNRKVCKDNCLATINPILSEEWHPTKNGKFTANDVLYGSHKKVWWLCQECDYEWQAVVDARNRGMGCILCAHKNSMGENNPNYNPNLTEEDRKDRRLLLENIDWRKEIYERDKYICQICGDNRGGIFNAHHLMGYNKYPKLRFDKNNGITLCKTCHMDFHNIYGRGNNTIAQFEKYKKSCELSGIRIS